MTTSHGTLLYIFYLATLLVAGCYSTNLQLEYLNPDIFLPSSVMECAGTLLSNKHLYLYITIWSNGYGNNKKHKTRPTLNVIDWNYTNIICANEKGGT